uniref:TSA: Wollemia nobilis Ref_Wollemi_Transcript_13379_1113 transcribed RNA sequence n=1 Tax=Wollemia nobilis TaxID=56998 RepID=A0A0C9QR12_9CONI
MDGAKLSFEQPQAQPYSGPTQITTGYPLLQQTSNPTAPYPEIHHGQVPPSPLPQYGGPQYGGPPAEWSSGLCDCGSDPCNCCLTCWCPCITFGQLAEIVDEGSPSCAVSGLVYGALLCFTGCACCYSCLYRTKMRSKFNLAENPCGDCLLHCFCESCAMCQEYRELKNRGLDPALGWTGNLQKQQRQSMGMGIGMTAPSGQTMS